MTIPKELQELRANIEDLSKKYKEIKAMPEDKMPEHDKMRDMEDMMMRMMDHAHSRISYLEDALYSWADTHMKNHPPHLKTASQMENYLKMCGMENDFVVEKPKITVAKANLGFEIR